MNKVKYGFLGEEVMARFVPDNLNFISISPSKRAVLVIKGSSD